jgi:hypothetical protein
MVKWNLNKLEGSLSWHTSRINTILRSHIKPCSSSYNRVICNLYLIARHAINKRFVNIKMGKEIHRKHIQTQFRFMKRLHIGDNKDGHYSHTT